MRRTVSPGGLRRRLTVAFMLAVGLSAAALAAGSYFVVRHNLLADSVDAGALQARRNLVVAPAYLRQSRGRGALVAAYQRTGTLAVGIDRGRPFSSSLSVDVREVPRSLREIVRRGDLGYQRETVAGTHYLIVGGPAGKDAELYYFFSEESLRHELAVLRNILLAGVGILVLVAGLVGALLARRTLRPVGRASEAARSLAEGLLETRLPVEGRDEFGAWAESFNEMAAALEAKIGDLSRAQARERRFTADVAHELRTPITALVAEASLLREHLDGMPADARRPVELLLSDVVRLRRLVEDLMEISRLDARRVSLFRRPVDLAALLHTIVGARGWTGQVEVAGEPVTLHTDPRRLERVLANLLANAVTHGGSGVTAAVRRSGAGVTVTVTDRGPGIAAEHLPHLFERFYKADPSRTGAGSGLGLAIAYENARLLGGRLRVDSTLGAGTRFHLDLPADPALPAPPGEAAPDGRAPTAIAGG
jgi:signal transduction histidine kinase